MRPDGVLEFLGRKDFRVKIRGYRVEVAEVEVALLDLPGVREAVVVGREDIPSAISLVAYIVPRGGTPSPSVRTLRQALAARLPEHAIPSRFVFLDALPTLPGGKVDRRALPPPGRERPELGTAPAPPRTPVEDTLESIWADVLNYDHVGIHDNFLELGGNSLTAARLLSRIRCEFGVNLPLSTLIGAGTIGRLAAAIEDVRKTESVGGQPRSESAKALFCLNYGFSLAKFLGSEVVVHALITENDELSSCAVIEEAAAICIQKMREIQPSGPYAICGHSVQGLLAFEMALQLSQQGEDVRLLALLDTFLPPRGFESLRRRLRRSFERLFHHGWVLLQTPTTQWRDYVHKRGKSAKRLITTGSSVVRTPAIGPTDQLSAMRWNYRPQPYPGVVTLYVPVQIAKSRWRRHLRTWPKPARGGLELVRVPGDHRTMIEEPFVQALARKILEKLAESETDQSRGPHPENSSTRNGTRPIGRVTEDVA